MLYRFSAEQDELRDVVRKLLAAEPAARRCYDGGPPGPDDGLWADLVGLGLAGLGVPEADGGSGGDVVDQTVVAEELGRAVAPVPFVANTVAAEAVRLAAPLAHRAGWLQGLADGSIVGAVALDGSAAGLDDGAARDATALPFVDGTVHGTLPMLFDAAGATLLIAVSDHGLCAVTDFRPEPVPTVDRTRPVSTATLEGTTAVLLDDVSGELVGHLRRRQLTLYAAEAAGVAAAVLERTAAYTVEREQFGRPIGTFQAVKHRLADMLVDVENARSAAYAAAWAAPDGAD
ncbi:MAG TPA: acyl-CoA dehydrogenase family protein, partial [Acidimicrobiia bacterium]|nr:acyl-CoA dehydrogenase family protein [Acidimicrobiia bacterium]